MNITDFLDTFTIVACSIIASAFILAWIYIALTDSSKFVVRKKWISQLPSVISTLGVLGTFLGITKGLMSFDTSDLDTSIPLLLDGLKTAFFTSLVGMFGSLILNRVVSHKFDTDVKESDEIKAAKLIIEALKNNHNALPSILRNSNQDLVKAFDDNETIKGIRIDVQQLKHYLEDIKGICVDVEQLKDDLEEIKGHIEELKEYQSQSVNILNEIKTTSSTTSDELPRLRAVAVTATASISTLDNNIEEMNDKISKIEKMTSEINENLDTIKLNNEEEF